MTYMFICMDCSRIFSVEMSLTKYNATSVHHCPNCCSRRTRRFFSEIPTVIYKGLGFTKQTKEDT